MSPTRPPAEPQPSAEPVADAAEPRPWRTPEDARGWRVLARGRGGPQPPPLVAVEVEFDQAQSEWLRREAERTGLDYPDLVVRLVDAARRDEAAPPGRPDTVGD
jgi:hypothetical protein